MPTTAAQRLKVGQVAKALDDDRSPVHGWVTIEAVDHYWSSTLLTADGRNYRVPESLRFQTLTDSQQYYLDEVRRHGSRTYNGRAAKPIKALEDAGLVTVNWDMRPQVKGNGMELVQYITVTPKEA